MDITLTIDSSPIALTISSAAGESGAAAFGATNKATIVDADKIAILDSAAADAPKHALFSLIKSTLTTAFNALYDSIGSAGDAQAAAVQRANHTGTQAHTTITGLGTAATTASTAYATAAQGATADTALQPLGVVSADVTDATSDGLTNPGKILKTDAGGTLTLAEFTIGKPNSGIVPLLTYNDGGVDGFQIVERPANLTDHRQHIKPDKSGTYALTSDITGTNSNTNTGDETGARIATILNAATPIAVLADDDKIGGTDTSASGIIGYITGAVLWTWIVSKLGALTSLTAGGAWAFSSTTRPTSSGTGTPASNSLITTADLDTRASTVIADFDYNSTTAPGATGGSGTWTYTLPTTAKNIRAILVSAGSGGGSGRCGAVGSNRSGGGGGASGVVTDINIPYASLASGVLTVTVGVGAAGGAAQLTSNTDGIAGTAAGAAGQATVANGATVIAMASHPTSNSYGRGGTSGSGAGGGISTSYGLSAPITGQTGAIGAPTPMSGTGYSNGGSGGGGVSSAEVVGRGGTHGPDTAGMVWGGAHAGIGGNPLSTDGGNGYSSTPVQRIPVGPQGSGGTGGIINQGGRGGDGARGSGGAGGGAGTNGVGSGAGGKGGDGFVRLIIEF